MPETTILLDGSYIENRKILCYKLSMKLLKNTGGSGYNLSDDRSLGVQYIDPMIGYYIC